MDVISFLSGVLVGVIIVGVAACITLWLQFRQMGLIPDNWKESEDVPPIIIGIALVGDAFTTTWKRLRR